uniref:Uncharacterized protein n=1 Tax=viral metagenome TaxID=1070528 RepID=A0A6M3KNY9_9ZZZZ
MLAAIGGALCGGGLVWLKMCPENWQTIIAATVVTMGIATIAVGATQTG